MIIMKVRGLTFISCMRVSRKLPETAVNYSQVWVRQ